ncbi:MAG: hypothetical protein F4Z54_02925, partial [Acidimicrobiaceae bacterium]|nr:hypothetical protein [Acidimicrobiaceae bacterium]
MVTITAVWAASSSGRSDGWIRSPSNAASPVASQAAIAAARISSAVRTRACSAVRASPRTAQFWHREAPGRSQARHSADVASPLMAGADTADTGTAPDSAARVRELQARLNHHSALYYAGKPEIPDGDFDSLLSELKTLEDRHPELVHPDSPTQRVGAPPDTAFAPVRHDPPMMSLHNALDIEELRAWHERVHRALAANTAGSGGEQALPTLEAPGVGDFSVELKFDGLAISCLLKKSPSPR